MSFTEVKEKQSEDTCVKTLIPMRDMCHLGVRWHVPRQGESCEGVISARAVFVSCVSYIL